MKWFCFYTRIRAEAAAGASICDLGFHTFVPLEKRMARVPGRKPKAYETALFPRYGFVQFSLSDRDWPIILDADGVLDLLRSDDKPMSINSQIIDGLRLADSCGLFDRTKPPKVGMSVIVTSGPFASALGRIERARTADRMDVLLKIFGGETRATIPLGSLREVAA